MIKNVLLCKQPNISWIHPINIDNSINANNFNFDYLDTLNKLRNSNLKILELRDVADKISDGPFGSQLKVEEYKEQGFPVYRVKNIFDTQILDDDIVYIDAKKQKQLKRSEVLPGDVLVTKAGRIGSAAVVPSKLGNGNITSHIALVRPRKTFNNYYLVAYLECKYGKFITSRESYKSTRPELTKAEIENVIIPIPSPEIQKYIGDKVRKAEELREEAKNIQNELDVILNKEIDNLINDYIYETKYNWTGKFDLEDRIDPNFYQKKYIHIIARLGENKVKLKEYVRISNRKYEAEKINKYIEISNIDNSFGTLDNVEELKPKEIPTSAKYQVKEGEILVSLVRPTRKAIAVITKEYDNSICTGGFAVLQSKGKVPVEFLTAVLRTDFVKVQFERYCSGSTYPTIDEDDVLKIFIPKYSENQINEIAEKYRRVISKIYQSKQLIQEAKQDVEDLIEGNFDMSKINKIYS